MPELVPDVLQLVFRELAGDNASLLNVSLTCRAWRSLALPALFQVVDISSHNNGRQPQHEDCVRSLVYADYDGEFRPQNLVPRQRAFLRLLTDKPELARYVKSFTWTLVWLDNWMDVCNEENLTEIDRQTWTVFGRMVNVTHLDLASLHYVCEDEYVRQNPAKLFPKVRDLRLLGWMHRALVRAIITSLEPRKLRCLKLDFLEDEGALPNGEPMGSDTITSQSHHAESRKPFRRYGPHEATGSEIYLDDLITRQETGNAFVFPGPMWLPLYLLSAHAMVSLSHLQIKLAPFDQVSADVRSYNTLFHQTASFIAKTKDTLKSLIIVFANGRWVYADPSRRRPCVPDSHRPWAMKMAKLFLEQLLAALHENSFPQLEKMRFEGFHILEDANPYEAARAELAGVLQLARESESRFINASFTDIKSLSGRSSFGGYDMLTDNYGRFADLLSSS